MGIAGRKPAHVPLARPTRTVQDGGALAYQPSEPGSPLNGPVSSGVIHPP
jgi:hypothetical protein